MLERLKIIDTEVLLYLNGKNSPFWDEVMVFVTHRFTWVPLYLLIAIFLVWKFKQKGLLLLLWIGILILAADQIASGICKPFFERLRPCHEPSLAGLIRVVSGCGGSFGFISSHASNTFAITTFLILLLNKHRWVWLFIPWTLLVSYSRIYLGVHYPGDILAGAVLGIVLGIIFFLAWKYFSLGGGKAKVS